MMKAIALTRPDTQQYCRRWFGRSSNAKTARNLKRPDTRPKPVADGWAGAEIRVFTLSNSIITDQQTDRLTDKASYRVASLCYERRDQLTRQGVDSTTKTVVSIRGGVLCSVLHRMGGFTSKTYFYIFLVFLRTPGTQEILIIPENAKNLKEVSPSSMSFRGPPPFNLSGFGVKKLKIKTMRRCDASSRIFVARR